MAYIRVYLLMSYLSGIIMMKAYKGFISPYKAYEGL